MRILVLGGNGMLGHQFFRIWRKNHDVKVTLRRDLDSYREYGLFNDTNSFTNIDIRSVDLLERVIGQFDPGAVVNAVGVTKQLIDSSNPVPSIEINSLFPHNLAKICERLGVRMIHLSSDCVFSGKKGFYSEGDISDAEDLYGRSKYFGEVNSPHVVTIRKSTLGLELSGAHGLIEWFLAQKGPVKGFRNAIYSGLISSELAHVIERILLKHMDLSGVWNLASEPISKFDLLLKLQQRLGRKDIEITPDDNFVCDRSLDGSRFEKETGYKSPAWGQMLDVLASQVEERV